MTGEDIAGRRYARVYRVSGRQALHDGLADAVAASGGELLYSSQSTRAPIFLGVQVEPEQRIGVLAYPFRCTTQAIKGRRPDERRLQLRYGGETSWDGEHPLGIDVAGVDVTVVLGLDLERSVFIGLDPLLYADLPMGISIEYKVRHLDAAVADSWTVWEREARPGRRRTKARAEAGLETLIAFTPDRFLDYVRFERSATSLGLDPPLRFRAAEEAGTRTEATALHRLEEGFELSGRQILDIITKRHRLEIAVRGGVAEHHLQSELVRAFGAKRVTQIDEDGQPDFGVTMRDGRAVTVECKNVSPVRRADGSIKVEVQKTRSSKSDPASRFYRLNQFDAVAACLWSATGRWEFVYKATAQLTPHASFPDRVAPIQTIDETWHQTLTDALA